MNSRPRTRVRTWRAALAGCIAVGVVAGCQRGDDAAPTAPPVIEARDAFHDAVRAPDGSLMIVGRYGKMLRSTNDGESWQPLASGVDRALFSLAFTDAQHGVAVGAYGLMLATADGGKTWQPRSADTDRQLFRVRFPTPQLGFVVGEFGTLWRSEDAGNTWTPLEQPWDDMLPAIAEQLGTVEPHLYDVAFCDAERGFVVGEYGLIVATVDGGKTWGKQHGGAPADAHLFTVECTGAGSVVAGGQSGTILYSADGGKEWSEEHGGVQDVYDLVALDDDNQLLAVGDLGSLRISSRAGQPGSWRDIAEPPGGPVWAARGIVMGQDVLLVGQAGARRVHLNGSTRPKAPPPGHG